MTDNLKSRTDSGSVSDSAALFTGFCLTLSGIRNAGTVQEKTGLFSNYLRQLTKEYDLELAVRFACEEANTPRSSRRLSIGHRTIALTASRFCGIDYEKVYKPCRAVTGNTPETIEKLMNNLPEAVSRRKPGKLSLGDIENFLGKMAEIKRRQEKESLLFSIWGQMTPLEIRYMIAILTGVSGHIGFETGYVLSSIAAAFQADSGKVRRLFMLTGSLPTTAVMIRGNKSESTGFRKFHPLPFMMAYPVMYREEAGALHDITGEIITPGKPGGAHNTSLPGHSSGLADPDDQESWVAEEKLQGLRIQIHISAGAPLLYSGDLVDVTVRFPGIVDKIQHVVHQRNQSEQDRSFYTVLDGVLSPTTHSFTAFDILVHNGKPVLDRPLHQRRNMLQQVCRTLDLPLIRQYEIRTNEDLHKRTEQAATDGREGLILKHSGSTYEAGRHHRSWLMLGRPAARLTTVIMYARPGSGRRGDPLTEFTLGIRVDKDERYEESFIPIGKITGELPEDERQYLENKIPELVVERFGPTLSLKPAIVAEVTCECIQPNRRSKAGLVLKKPFLHSIRHDITPSEIDTFANVERLTL